MFNLDYKQKSPERIVISNNNKVFCMPDNFIMNPDLSSRRAVNLPPLIINDSIKQFVSPFK